MYLFKQFVALALLTSTFAFFPAASMGQETSDIVSRLRLAAEADSETQDYLRNVENQIKRQRQDQLLRSLLQTLYTIAPSGSLTVQQIEQRNAMDQARLRATQVGRMLAWDLDGDGTISQTERDVFSGTEAVDIELLFARGDTDGNGAISLTELRQYAAEQASANVRTQQNSYLMLFDVNQDAAVTANEIVATIDALSENPLNIVAEPRRLIPQREETSVACSAPKPSDETDVIVLSGYEGAALSSVSIAGMDGVTHVAHLVIEPGEKPVYLFLSAHSNMIWDISGELGRLAQVVVQKSNRGTAPGAGVVGVPREKVHFVEPNSCIKPVHNIEGGEGIIAYRQVARSLQQEPDHMLAHYTIGSISLPSGEGDKAGGEGTDILLYDGRRYEMTPEGPRLIDEAEGQRPGDRPYGASQTFRSLKRFHPGGVRAIEADAVVAPGDAMTYDVMPQEAGLLQLLLEEKVSYTRDGFYMILEPIARFPAGLAGAHQVKFMLAENVPMPAGSPGHSSVYSAESGECISGLCR